MTVSVGTEGSHHVLERFQVRHVVEEGLFEDVLRTRSGKVQVGELARAVGELDRLADDVAVEVLDQLLGPAGLQVEEVRLAVARQQDMVEEKVIDNFGGRSCQKSLAAGADRQSLDIVSRQVVQETAGIGAADLDLAAVRQIEQGSR